MGRRIIRKGRQIIRKRRPVKKLKERKEYATPQCTTLKGESVSQWQEPKLRARTLSIMETEPPEIRRRMLALLEKKTRKFVGGQKSTVYVRNVTQEELDIIRRVRKKGIFTEMPFSFKLRTAAGRKRAPMGFVNAGESLHVRFRASSMVEERDKIMGRIADILGKMHSAGIEHGHATVYNIYEYKERLSLADFSIAERHAVDWRSAQNIYNSFVRDYGSQIMRALALRGRLDYSYWMTFFKKMVSHYPASEKVKREVLKKINRAFFEYWENDVAVCEGPI